MEDCNTVNEDIVFNLLDISHTMRALYEGRGSQKQILIVLNDMGETITQRELTERLGIQPGSASEVIAKMESAGFIRRSPSQTDRRTADVELTETGKEAAAQAKEERLLRHQKMFSCLSEKEKEQLLSLLKKINFDWGQRYENTRVHTNG
ncbi:MAG: MarR family winged helix-turn-helix transcriptional regulator [Roseburia sp.]